MIEDDEFLHNQIERIASVLGIDSNKYDTDDGYQVCMERMVNDVIARISPASSGDIAICGWEGDGEAWKTGCHEYFVLNDGTPSQNGMKFCPYCGKLLKEISAHP